MKAHQLATVRGAACRLQRRRLFLPLVLFVLVLALVGSSGVEGKSINTVLKNAVEQYHNYGNHHYNGYAGIAHHARRHKRAEPDYVDENANIIPVLVTPEQKRLEDHIQEQAAKIAENFKNMWESLTASIQHGVEALKRIFGADTDDGGNGYATDVYSVDKATQDNEILMKNYQNRW